MIIAITKEELLREKIVKLALLQHHKEYKHGSHGPDTFDCAGFAWYIYNEVLGIDIYKEGAGLSTTTMIMNSPHGTIHYFSEGLLTQDLTIVNKGDILLFHRQDMNETEPKKDNKYPGHCGIYMGDNKFIHAPSTQGKIILSNFEKRKYWVKKLVASKDYITKINKD